MRPALAAARPALAALALLSACAGCDLIDAASGGYAGPLPSREGLDGETALVADMRPGPHVEVELVLDRVRFVDAGTPHDVNRVVKARTTPANQAEVAALGLREGDRVTLSTTFVQIDEGGGSMGVADWPVGRLCPCGPEKQLNAE